MSECTSEKCQCAICSRNYKKPEPVAEVERFENIHEVPFGESLLVVLERLTSARLVHPVSLHVPETFFFKNSKVHSYYYSNSKGELCLFPGPVPLKKVETVIMGSLTRDHTCQQMLGRPPPSPNFSEVQEKEQRQRKMKNDVALMKQVNGGYALISEFNLPFEVQKARHIEYIQLFRKEQPEFVKFDYQTDKSSELYNRASEYALTMKGQYTDWDTNYLGKREEVAFELELFRKELQSLLQYRTFKLVHLLNLTGIRVLKGRFDWSINSSTATISLHNVEGLQHCAARPSSKIDLETFERQRMETIKKKIAALETPERKTHYQWNHRVTNYEHTLYQNYERVKNGIIDHIPQLEQISASDRAFKVLHPEIKSSLSEVLKHQSLCRRTMRSLFPRNDRPSDKPLSHSNIRPAMPQTTKPSSTSKIPWRKREQQSMERQKTLFRQSFRRNLKHSRMQTQPNLQTSTIEINLSRVLERTRT